MRAVLLAAVVLASLAGAAVLNGLRGPLGISLVQTSPADLSARLAPAYRVTRPAGAGPFPAALLLSGCDGPKDNLDTLARRLSDIGWASVIVDSHGPRDLDDLEAWRAVCAGQVLNGAERAADLMVALADLRHMDGIDGDRIALIGASHGGWTVLDALSLAATGTLPPVLSGWPEGDAAATLRGVRAVALLYPYCGLAMTASAGTLPVAPVYLFVLVEGDTVVDETACARLADELREDGARPRIVTLSGVTHGFDQREKNALSALRYDEEATERAWRAIEETLGELSRQR